MKNSNQTNTHFKTIYIEKDKMGNTVNYVAKTNRGNANPLFVENSRKEALRIATELAERVFTVIPMSRCII